MSIGTVTNKIIDRHLAESDDQTRDEMELQVDQTLCQDATGTMVMLELEAMGLDEAKTELSVQYVDHNITQDDFKNADDHLFLQSFCARLGIVFSPAGNGISHPLHMSKFAKPGQILVGSDSHTCASGGIGTLAIGMGGLDVARAIAGFPINIRRPKILGVHLSGKLPDWVSAKDVALYMLKVFDVNGLRNYIIEYYGEGVENLSIMDRHVICNMAIETGATCGIFPSDAMTRKFLKQHERERDWIELRADEDAIYDKNFEINLSNLVPLIARPSSPGNVVEVAKVQGEPIYQAYIGSSANPGFRDFAIGARMLEERIAKPGVSLDINPSTREVLTNLLASGDMQKLISAGARLHQAGCNGCIGMGQAPASGKNSLRTTPRNFKGRSGTVDDSVWLCSPETAFASAITGEITDPTQLGITYPKVSEPDFWILNKHMFIYPPKNAKERKNISILRGPNIKSLPIFEGPEDIFQVPVIAKFGDNISTDDILPAGNRILPFRSNLPELAKFTFNYLMPIYYQRTLMKKYKSGHVIVAGTNYGQGSSREHAALAPRYLGLRAVIAKSYSRIHRQNLINFGVIPFEFENPKDYDLIQEGNLIKLEGIHSFLLGADFIFNIVTESHQIRAIANLTKRQREVIACGGLLTKTREQLDTAGILNKLRA